MTKKKDKKGRQRGLQKIGKSTIRCGRSMLTMSQKSGERCPLPVKTGLLVCPLQKASLCVRFRVTCVYLSVCLCVCVCVCVCMCCMYVCVSVCVRTHERGGGVVETSSIDRLIDRSIEETRKGETERSRKHYRRKEEREREKS